MDIIFMNSKNSKTSDPHRLLFSLTDKMNLKRSDKYVALYISIYKPSHLLFMEKYKKVIQKQ